MKRIPSDCYKKPLNLPDQRVSFNNKLKPEWYIPTANYIIEEAFASCDKSKTLKFLQAANAIVDKSTYDYVMKNYIDIVGDNAQLYAEIRDVDFLTPIKERYMGEFINLFNNYQIINASPDAILKRNKDVSQKVMNWINQEVINELNKRYQESGGRDGVQTNQPTIEQEEIDKLIKDNQEKWIDEVVENSVNRIEFFNLLQNAKEKYIQAYFYWWSCEEVYSYRTIEDDDVSFEIISPLEYYRVHSGERYVEDDDMGMRYFQLTIPQIKERFRDIISDKEIKYLEDLYASSSGLNKDRFLGRIRSSVEDWSVRDTIINYTKLSEFKPYLGLNNKMVDCFHYVWKTEVKVGYLTYTDIDGQIKSNVVDETYEIDTTLGDIEIKWDWIQQVWEGYRFGGILEGIYTKPSAIPCQREHFGNLSNVKLPYNGIVGLINENFRNPIPYRLIPYLALYRIYTLQQERAIHKFKSWLILPESLFSDSTQMTSEARIAAANKDSVYFYDDSDANANVLQNIREVANTALNNYIQNLEGLKNNIKNEVYELSNMNSSRLGQARDYTGKAVMEQNYANALAGSVWLLDVFNNFRERDYLANLDYTKWAWIGGKSGSYVNSTNGEVVTFDLDGTSDFSTNIGIFMKNSYQTNAMLEQMKQYAFAAAQNGELSIALEAITNQNVISLKNNIEKAVNANREYQMQLQAQQEQMRQQVEMTISQRQEQAQNFEREKLTIEGQQRLDQINAEYDRRLELEQVRWNVDTNRNNRIDKDEADTALNKSNQNNKGIIN